MGKRICQEVQDLLDAKWDGGTLGEADAALVESHLRDCIICAAFERDMAQVLAAAAELDDVRYHHPVEVAPLVLQPRAYRPWLLGFATASGLALAVAFGFYLGAESARGPDAGAAVPSQEVVVRLAVPLPSARTVSVLGDFTGWQGRIPLSRSESGMWVGELRVPAGRYRYVLVVDDARMQPDPAAPQVVDDGFGGQNSVLDVPSL